MAGVNHILAATDFSERSEQALPERSIWPVH
jgi:hypothetical protein